MKSPETNACAARSGPRPAARGRHFSATIFFGVWVCLGFVCSGQGAPPAETLNLQLKWRHQFQFAGYYAAQAKGFYAAEGLEVKIREGGPHRPPLAAVLGGEAQFGVSDTDVLLARMRGQPLVVCAAIFQHSPYVLLSRWDRNIRSPADLVGASIMLSDDQGDTTFRAMMIREGIDPQRVKILPQSWNLDDLIAKRVDAISAYAMVEPQQLLARGIQPALLRSIDYGVDFYGDTLFTTEGEIARNPKRAAAFVRASLKGWDYAMQHPDEITALILKMDGVAGRGIAREDLIREAQAMRPFILPEVVEIGHMNPGRWQSIAETFVTLGMVPAGFTLPGFIYEPDPPFNTRVLRWAAGLGVALLVGVALVLLWNAQTRRKVRERTRELQDEVHRRKEVEQELVASEQRFRQLAENITEVFWLLDLTDRRTVYVSPAYEKVWGRSRTSLYEAPPGGWLDALHPEDRGRVAEAATTKQIRGDYDEIYRIHLPDGAVRWIHDRAYPVRDSTGKIYRIVGIAQDITERKLAEAKLMELASLLDKTRDAILVRNLEDHQITFWSKSAESVYGWSAAEAIGHSARELLYRDLPAFDGAMQSLRRQGNWDGEITQISKQGTEIVIAARWTLVSGEEGRPDSVLCINTDITQRKLLEKQFLRAQRMESIGTLASGIAHDLNNVLAPILMSIALQKLDMPDNEKLQRQLDQLAANTERGANLVRQLLTFGRGFEGEMIPIQVKHVAREVAQLVEDTFPKNIEFEHNFPSDLWCILADPTQMHQVMLNLCVNARDAMPRGGTLSLNLENSMVDEKISALHLGCKPGPHVVIAVADTGMGIPAAIREKIFDPFFTTKEPGKGTGLGLSTTLAIVRSHGGFLDLESTEGHGTTFKIYLPASATAVAPAVAETPSERIGGNELILVVDDEAVIRDVSKRILERFGYRVLLAENGIQAVTQYAVHRNKIAVVVTDMTMPIMDGPATILALRGINPNVKIIASSGNSADAAKKEAGSVGANIAFFIAKPYTTDALLQAIRTVIAQGSRAPFMTLPS